MLFLLHLSAHKCVFFNLPFTNYMIQLKVPEDAEWRLLALRDFHIAS